MTIAAMEDRFWGADAKRPGDVRTAFERDRARIIHSAAFRRLQGKTQVMGVGEGDFHRTRLTHSIEASQIGEGILCSLERQERIPRELKEWFPERDLIIAACLAHDLGHPPFGHAGERALHRMMVGVGGFEGNGQTLRILTRLEKQSQGHGINPTRRLILAVLKYPACFSDFDPAKYASEPPKCYLETERDIVEWAMDVFEAGDKSTLRTARDEKDKPCRRTFDASVMECADDIAYAVHDLEDIVARKLVGRAAIGTALDDVFKRFGGRIGADPINLDDLLNGLFDGGSHDRKRTVSRLVNLFISSARVQEVPEMAHPLLKHRVGSGPDVEALLHALKKLTYILVINRAATQHIERRGQLLVEGMYRELIAAPDRMVPEDARRCWAAGDTPARKVCDYIAGMTDTFAERIYRRIHEPGFGSCSDEL